MEKIKKFSLTKMKRLKSKKDFQNVYTNGHSVVDALSIIYVFAAPGAELKIGLAVGKKLGNAVTRNHIKRMMREVFRKRQYELKDNFNIVWVARKKLVVADLKTYERVFLRLVKRAGLLR
ncbi:MAG: ribonuclease P protein component [Acidaminococcaceae bacterium]